MWESLRMSSMNGEYYDYMEDGQLEALAKRKIKSRESIADMLDYLDSDILKRVMQELLG